MCTHILHFSASLGAYAKRYAQINNGGEISLD